MLVLRIVYREGGGFLSWDVFHFSWWKPAMSVKAQRLLYGVGTLACNSTEQLAIASETLF